MHAKSAKTIARWLSGLYHVFNMLNVKIAIKGVNAMSYIVNNNV